MLGQNLGSIVGVVRDQSGTVVPGVTVEASSAALIEGKRATTTGGNGEYRIVDLRPGDYTVTFTHEGFRTVRRENVTLGASNTVTLNEDLCDRTNGAGIDRFRRSATGGRARTLLATRNGPGHDGRGSDGA